MRTRDNIDKRLAHSGVYREIRCDRRDLRIPTHPVSHSGVSGHLSVFRRAILTPLRFCLTIHLFLIGAVYGMAYLVAKYV
jgi:DNA-binding transcriptional ArsR family regulator